jgi:hypothetical protein
MTKNKTIKDRIIPLIILGCMGSMAMVSCQSHEQKADDAFTKVKEGKILYADSEIALTEPKTIEVIKKIEMLDDWSKFKIETEKRIAINEKKIRDIKGTPKADAKLFKKVSTSEQENTDLRRQINEYEEALNINLKEFKAKINQNMDAINSDLNDITASVKK